MKEIKFKAWDTQENKMNTIGCLGSGSGAELLIIEWQGGLSSCNAYGLPGGPNPTFDKPLTERFKLLQSTGLKRSDAGGMPIQDLYFGDIIRFFNTDGNEHQAEIIWYEEEHCIGFRRLTDGFVYTQRIFNDSGYFQPSKLQFEIIGNIYENPDLLSASAKTDH